MKNLITVFFSSLFLLAFLFYYWQKDSELISEVERVKITVFARGDKDNLILSIKGLGNVESVYEVTGEEVLNRLSEDIGEEVELIEFPMIVKVCPLRKNLVELDSLVAGLKKIEGVSDVVYGRMAFTERDKNIKEIRAIVAISGFFFLVVFVLSISSYIGSMAVMRNWEELLVSGGNLLKLRTIVVLGAVAASGISAIVSAGIVYLSLLYISPGTAFLPQKWIYLFVLGSMGIGLFIGVSKRFPLNAD